MDAAISSEPEPCQLRNSRACSLWYLSLPMQCFHATPPTFFRLACFCVYLLIAFKFTKFPGPGWFSVTEAGEAWYCLLSETSSGSPQRGMRERRRAGAEGSVPRVLTLSRSVTKL